MNSISQMFQSFQEDIIALTPRLLVGLAVLLVFVLLSRLITKFLTKVGRRKSGKRSENSVEIVNRIVKITMAVIGVVMALQIMGLTALATSLLATGGVVAVILGFAFREIGENLLAGLFLSFNRSFEEGDLIESGGIRGVVRNINLRDIHIRTGEGCDIYIPSAAIFRQPLHNFTRDGLRRSSFTVGIDYGDDPQKARTVMLEVVKQSDYVLAEPAPSVQIAGFSAAYIELEVFFWIDAFADGPGLPAIRTRLMDRCREALLEEEFTFSSNVKTGLTLDPVELRKEE